MVAARMAWAVAVAVLRAQRGVTALEYGLLAGVVGAAVITGANLLGTHLNTTFSHLAAKLNY